VTASPNLEEIRTHLEAMVSRLPEDAGLVLVKRRTGGRALGRASDQLVTVDTLDASVDLCANLAPDHDLWVSTTATDHDTFAKVRDQGNGKRGGAEDARYVLGTFADIDAGGIGHSKTGLPPSLADAQRILDKMPPPSLLIGSGGGLHPWWLLVEPLEIAQDRERAEALADGWVRTLGSAANELGWTFDDGIGDLARILRVAGTLNHKTRTPRPVTIEAHDTDDLIGMTTRYHVEELERQVTWRPSSLPPKTTPPATTSTTSTRSSGLDILDACNAAPWSDLWPPEWSMVGTEVVDGTPVELWRRPDASSDHSVKCWPDGGCRVWSEAIEGLPAGNHSKADVLVWRTGTDRSTLARQLLGHGSMSHSIPATVSEAAREIRSAGDGFLDSLVTTRTTTSTNAGEAPRMGFETISARDLIAEVAAMGAPRWLFRGVWASEDYGVVAGSAKAGKTWSCIDAAISAASGTPWLGRFDADLIGPVLYFVGEGGKRKIMRRSMGVAEGRGLYLGDLPIQYVMRAPNLSDDVAIENLRITVDRVRPVLTIVDPFYLAGGAKADASKLNSMGEVLINPQMICQEANSALMVAAHCNRNKGASGLDQISGAGLAEWARIVAILTDTKHTKDILTGRTSVDLKVELIGDEIAGEIFTVNREIWQDDPDDLASPMHYVLSRSSMAPEQIADMIPPKLEPMLKVLEAAEGHLTKREISERLRAQGHTPSDSTIRNHLEKLMAKGRVERDDRHGTPVYRIQQEVDPLAERVEVEPLL